MKLSSLMLFKFILPTMFIFYLLERFYFSDAGLYSLFLSMDFSEERPWYIAMMAILLTIYAASFIYEKIKKKEGRSLFDATLSVFIMMGFALLTAHLLGTGFELKKDHAVREVLKIDFANVSNYLQSEYLKDDNMDADAPVSKAVADSPRTIRDFNQIVKYGRQHIDFSHCLAMLKSSMSVKEFIDVSDDYVNDRTPCLQKSNT